MSVHPPQFLLDTVWADDFTILTSAYSAGDVVGGLLTFPVALRATEPAGVVDAAIIVDRDDEGAAFTLYLFEEEPTAIADGDSFTGGIAAADMLKMIGKPLSISTYNDYGSFRRAYAAWSSNEEPRYKGGDGNIYGYLVCAGTPTFAAVDKLSVGLPCWRY